MKRLNFDSRGRLIGVDKKLLEFDEKDEDNGFVSADSIETLKTSDDLQFLKRSGKLKSEDREYWSLYHQGKKLEPLKFSNGKTQEDIVREIVESIQDGNKIIFLHGTCGTGKSAIALNIARQLGRTSIVVPVKGLQKQYENDYMNEKYLLNKDGEKMRIAMITGRENHDSIIRPGVSCADSTLPDTIKITEKNFGELRKYYFNNPLISNKGEPMIDDLRRISIAPSNPYWSPIAPAEIELKQLRDARKIKYKGINGKDFIFYHRKEGCSYYDQYLAYVDADVIIFNSAKYKTELALGRKPETEVEIIDEADEFLDSLAIQKEINLRHLQYSLQMLNTDNPKAREAIKKTLEYIVLEERHKAATGVNEEKIFKITETHFGKMLEVLARSPDLEAEILTDELNYSNKALEAAKDFVGVEDIYLTYRKKEGDIYVTLVSTDLSKKVNEIINNNKALVFMSGTLHSSEVLKNIFGIADYKIVEAETIHQGNVRAVRTGKEFDCSYKMLREAGARKKYLEALNYCMENAKNPTLIHVNAYNDLPSEEEMWNMDFLSDSKLISKNELEKMQEEDKTGGRIMEFKSGKTPYLFTTKCSRGIDFPGEICNSVIFTKYPNPNVNGTFWKVLQETHKNYYWDFYFDKARREFLQRIYRAVRSEKDSVYVLSPDLRVLNAAKKLG